MTLLHLQLMAAGALVLIAAIVDFKTGKIPNLLIAIGLALGLLSGAAVGFASDRAGAVLHGLLYSSAGALGCALLPGLLYAARSIGGGDLKLFIALGSLVGPLIGLEAELYTFCAGALYVFGLLAYEGILFRSVADSFVAVSSAIVRRPNRRAAQLSQRSVRFGPLIAVGTWLALLAHWSGS
ncbi:MAG TPA: A24 family peptidase [Polyangiales bacterium]|jgi:prepilin peptidase CpaA